MKRFEYKRWNGGKRTVECDVIEFTSTHVLFKRGTLYSGYTLVVGEREMQVNELKEIECES